MKKIFELEQEIKRKIQESIFGLKLNVFCNFFYY